MAHQVIATIGDRWVLVRPVTQADRRAAGRQAMSNVASETTMRGELSEVVGDLLRTVSPAAHVKLTQTEQEGLLGLADIVTRARTPVERDFQGNPAQAHDLSCP